MRLTHVFAWTALTLPLIVHASSPSESLAQVQPTQSEIKTMPVCVDPRIELLSIVFRLIDAGEYNQPSSDSAYARAVATHFAPFKDHRALNMASELREQHSIGFDGVSSFAAHLKDIETCEFAVSINPIPATISGKWTPELATKFAQALREFVKDSDFNRFWTEQADFRTKAEAAMRETLSRKPYREWIEQFFGKQLLPDSKVIIGLLNGGGNYGNSLQREDGVAVFPTIGVWNWDENGVPKFPDSVAETIVHEFCHPFVNPVIDQHYALFAPAGEWLVDQRGSAFERQAYSGPKVAIYESVVRGCVTRIVMDRSSPEAGRANLAKEVGDSFLLTPTIVDALTTYVKSRESYKTLDDFAPLLAKAMTDAVQDSKSILDRVPTLTTMSPADGSRSVAREVAFRLEFDRPMDKSSRGLSFIGATFERVVASAFDDSGKVYTVTLRFPAESNSVKGHVNRGWSGFRTAEGYTVPEKQFEFHFAE